MPFDCNHCGEDPYFYNRSFKIINARLYCSKCLGIQIFGVEEYEEHWLVSFAQDITVLASERLNLMIPKYTATSDEIIKHFTDCVTCYRKINNKEPSWNFMLYDKKSERYGVACI